MPLLISLVIRDLVGTAAGVWFYAAGMAVYLFFLLRSQQLTAYFEIWRRSSERVRGTMAADTMLSRDLNWISLLVLGSCFGENFMFHFYSMSPAQLERIGKYKLQMIEIENTNK
jgi:hypothetical protein